MIGEDTIVRFCKNSDCATGGKDDYYTEIVGPFSCASMEDMDNDISTI